MDEITYKRERDRLKNLLAEAPAPPPVLDLHQVLRYPANMRTLVDIATPEEQRALIRQVLEQVWIEKREVKKVKPISAYSALLKAVNGTCGFMGCLTGLEHAKSVQMWEFYEVPLSVI